MTLASRGCLLNRVAETRDQFCDFDSNFKLQFDGSPEFSFLNPVLLDKDILWMADAEPTELIFSDNEKSMIFVIEKAVDRPDPADDIRIELSFQRLEEQYKLASIRFDPKLKAMINQDLMDQLAIESAAQNLCSTHWSMASTKVEVDISAHDLESLPNRLEILELLGLPVYQESENDSFGYEYRLKGESQAPALARFTIWFDDSGQKPARMESQYSHFHTSTDFVQKKMIMRVKI